MTPSETLIAKVRAIIRQARDDGAAAREHAPSRSTGYRRQFKTSHEALRQIERVVGED